jgi:hypothetical protein
LKDINRKLITGDTITVGLDYYYLWPVSIKLGKGVPEAITLRFKNGEVITEKIWNENNITHWKEFGN